jgi:hypothetical protein
LAAFFPVDVVQANPSHKREPTDETVTSSAATSEDSLDSPKTDIGEENLCRPKFVSIIRLMSLLQKLTKRKPHRIAILLQYRVPVLVR